MEQLVLEDLEIRDFEVAAISINGFVDVLMQRIEIGAILQSVPLKGSLDSNSFSLSLSVLVLLHCIFVDGQFTLNLGRCCLD